MDGSTPAAGGGTPATACPVPAPAPAMQPLAETNVKKPIWKRKILWPVYGFIALVIAIAATGGGSGDDDVADSDPVTSEDVAADADGTEIEAVVDTGEGDSEDAEAAPVEPEPAVGVATRDNPIPVGQTIELTAEALGDAGGSVWSLTVVGPAQDVTSPAVSQGFAADPIEGNILVGVPIELTLVAAGKEPLAPIFNLDVEFFSPTTATIAETLLRCGFWDQAFDSNTEAFIGGSVTGLLCAEVAAADLGNGLLITADEQGDRVFLATE